MTGNAIYNVYTSISIHCIEVRTLQTFRVSPNETVVNANTRLNIVVVSWDCPHPVVGRESGGAILVFVLIKRSNLW